MLVARCQESAACLVAHIDAAHPTLSRGHTSSFLGIEMILTSAARQDLAIFGDLETLQI